MNELGRSQEDLGMTGRTTGITIDADGRDSSGRAMSRLAGEHTAYVNGLSFADEAPLPYEEFAAGYRELRASLHALCEQLADSLDHAGAGQIAMAVVNMETELANGKLTDSSRATAGTRD
ncbi:hypothetical protein [Streptosporangium sp. NBC_01756]|uniref:hypothetical protein n=1 Tax=Streptosporangium sp. NBC_01756 TaxID=2975950 RepID=UPI002DD7CD4C|nr:hypothetical protein [Streptosporangium sp. NBC_01756]WSC83219.1 hypothetical protein OIE48_22655 [Streptosporangium sp. NBC_01756]